MTTPTKEQIEEILCDMQEQGYFWDSIDYEDEYEVLEFIITAWEKIKDVDERVEKMCKNNPGIKDFEDFNKAINSPK